MLRINIGGCAIQKFPCTRAHASVVVNVELRPAKETVARKPKSKPLTLRITLVAREWAESRLRRWSLGLRM